MFYSKIDEWKPIRKRERRPLRWLGTGTWGHAVKMKASPGRRSQESQTDCGFLVPYPQTASDSRSLLILNLRLISVDIESRS